MKTKTTWVTLNYVVILSDVRTVSGQVKGDDAADAQSKAIKEIERIANDGFWTGRSNNPAFAAFVGGDNTAAKPVVFEIDAKAKSRAMKAALAPEKGGDPFFVEIAPGLQVMRPDK